MANEYTEEQISRIREAYPTPQQQQLDRQSKELGQQTLRSVESEWPTLIADVKRHMDSGTDPCDERVKELARRWHELVNMFTGGDSEIKRTLTDMYEQGSQDIRSFGDVPDRAMIEYINKSDVSTA